jgi:hypothetical protein
MARIPAGTVEFREEPTPITLRTHDKGRSFQLLNSGLAICHLPELNPMLTEWIFKLREAKFHLHDLWGESLTETTRLFG